MTSTSIEDPDFRVRREVYDQTLTNGRPPATNDLAARLQLPIEEIRASLRRLAATRVLVLQPGAGEILMANPFSAIPTPFVVETPAYSAFGNCIWDALGISAMLRQPARVRTACGCCGEAIELDVDSGAVRSASGTVHFAVPALGWWEDIVFT
ncbi:MAG: organomercurial lyase [Gemmatimonadota bacterium]